jgi:hypothetical protein
MDNFDFKKYLVENNLGPFSGLGQQDSNQEIDVNATLRALQSAVKSGADVTIDGEKVFKMPMFNLATFVSGGKTRIPDTQEALEAVADSILVDGQPMELLYKNAKIATTTPVSKLSAGDTSGWTDSTSPFYRGGD